MKPEQLNLILTDRCTARCNSCPLSCSPDGQQVMDAVTMEKTIREASEAGIKSVCFSGGEPFLCPELLEEGVRIARECKLSVIIMTNGFWGVWESEKIKDTLTTYKPDMICFLYDRFHREYVSEDTIGRAFSAVHVMKIGCMTYIPDMTGDDSAGHFIYGLNKLRFNMEFTIYPLVRTGRAAELPEELFLTQRAESKSATAITVFYNGDISPCGLFNITDHYEKIGNLDDMSLEAAISACDTAGCCSRKED